MGNDGDAITQDVSLVHMMSGQDDGAACFRDRHIKLKYIPQLLKRLKDHCATTI